MNDLETDYPDDLAKCARFIKAAAEKKPGELIQGRDMVKAFKVLQAEVDRWKESNKTLTSALNSSAKANKALRAEVDRLEKRNTDLHLVNIRQKQEYLEALRALKTEPHE